MNSRGDVIWSGPTPVLFATNGAGGYTTVNLLDYFVVAGFVDLYDEESGEEIYGFKVTDINDLGQITGYTDVRVRATRAARPRISYFYSPPVNVGGSTLPERFYWIVSDSGLNLVAGCLNNSGIVTGSVYSQPGVDTNNPFAWSENSVVSHLGTFGTMTLITPQGINSLGQICGTGTNNSDEWVYSPGVGYRRIFSKEPYQAVALEINDSGQVVGNYRSTVQSMSYGYRATSSGSITTIKMGKGLPTELLAINSSGAVVGSGYNGTEWRPIIYTDARGVVDLQTASQGVPTGILSGQSSAVDVNDNGQVLILTTKVGTDGQYLRELYIATPIQSAP
jgi:hypothetical protein